MKCRRSRINQASINYTRTILPEPTIFVRRIPQPLSLPRHTCPKWIYYDELQRTKRTVRVEYHKDLHAFFVLKRV